MSKERIQKLIEIFIMETDEEHELSYDDLLTRLNNYGFEVELRAIKNDIKALGKGGFDLIENTHKFGKKFFSHQNRKFATYELRMILDVIYSAEFITNEDREKPENKVKSLTSVHIAEDLKNKVFSADVITSDKTYKYRINDLYNAIQSNKTIKFEYGRYDLCKKFILTGKVYKADPYGIVWDNGFYYLIAYGFIKNEFINFRIDRMRDVVIEDEFVPISGFCLKEHISKCFNMYTGEEKQIKIRFDKHLINAIINKFGMDAMIKIQDNNFVLITKAAISTGLVRWILNWGADA